MLQVSGPELGCGRVCTCAQVPGEVVPAFTRFLLDQLVYNNLVKDKK